MSDYNIQAGVAVIENEKGEHLLIQQAKGKPLSGQWRHPGGWFNPGETPAQAMSRELREEMGLEIKILSNEPLLVLPSEYATVDFGFYKAQLIGGIIRPDASEVSAYNWYLPKNALELDLMEATRTFYERK